MNKNSTILLAILLIFGVSTLDISRSYGQTEILPGITMLMIATISANRAEQLQNIKDRNLVFQNANKILREKFPNVEGAEYWQVENNGFLRKFNINSEFNVHKLIHQGDGYLLVKWDGVFEIVKYGFWKNNVIYNDKWEKWLK